MVTDGKWKLIRGFDEKVKNYYSNDNMPVYADMQQFTLLFDLGADPLENENLAEKHPEVVERLAPLLQG